MDDVAFELGQVSDGDRAFSAAITRDYVPESIKELGALARWKDEDPGILVGAFRAFLVRHFSAHRCGDGVDSPDLRVTQWFNDDLRDLTSMDVAPIDYEEFSGHRVDRMARIGEPRNTPEFNALVQEIALSLRPGRRGSPTPPSLTRYLKTPETVVGDLLVWHGVGERSMTEFGARRLCRPRSCRRAWLDKTKYR